MSRKRGKLHRVDRIEPLPGEATRWLCRDCGMVTAWGRFGPKNGVGCRHYLGDDLIQTGNEARPNMPTCPPFLKC